MQFTQHTVQCIGASGLHRMAYTEWGARDNPRVLICVHGLTRNEIGRASCRERV